MSANNASAFRKVINAGSYWVGKDRLEDVAQTLTNKTLTSATITAASNNVLARGLWYGSGSASISTYAAGAPTATQVLTATSATTATWQTPVVSALGDVTISGIAEQDLLSWNNATSRWNNRTVAAALKGGGTTSILIGHPTSYATGTNTITIGTSSGSAATGNNCIAIGTDALDDTVTAVTDVIAIGRNALTAAVTQNNTIAIGYNALAALTTGSGNVMVGANPSSTVTITTGSNNTIVGTGITVTGSDNTVIGASTATSSGSGCTVVGISCASTSSNYTTVIGRLGSAFGHHGVIVGNSSATTGDGAVCIGTLSYASGYSCVLGYSAGNNAIGAYNVAIGYDALDGAAGAVTDCVAIGRNALTAALTTGANYSVGIGYNALTALTSGAANIGIGYQAGDTLTTGSNNTVLGYDADVDAVGRAGCTIIGKGAVSTADSQFVVATNNGANYLRSTLAVDPTPRAAATYLPVYIGGVQYYIPLYT